MKHCSKYKPMGVPLHVKILAIHGASFIEKKKKKTERKKREKEKKTKKKKKEEKKRK